MNDNPSHFLPNRHPFSASSALEAIAFGLNSIKADGHLSDMSLADPLFTSPDRVRDYRLAHSEMRVSTFLRGLSAWGEAFAGPAMALVGYAPFALQRGKVDALPVCSLLHKLIAAKTDGHISDSELLDMAPEVMATGAAVDTLRARIADLRAGVR